MVAALRLETLPHESLPQKGSSRAQDGKFKGGNVVGEVGLAPFHDLEPQVSAAVKAKLAEIDKGLKDNSIKVGFQKPTGNCPQA